MIEESANKREDSQSKVSKGCLAQLQRQRQKTSKGLFFTLGCNFTGKPYIYQGACILVKAVKNNDKYLNTKTQTHIILC